MRTAAVLIALATAPLLAAVPLPPAPTHSVTDNANLLYDQREYILNERLARLDRETTNQLLVYVDRKLPEGTTIEEMSAQAIRTWAPGQKKTDNGAILFLFVEDRQSRIQVGYGLEGALTDAVVILVARRPHRAWASRWSFRSSRRRTNIRITTHSRHRSRSTRQAVRLGRHRHRRARSRRRPARLHRPASPAAEVTVAAARATSGDHS